jgi:hypothetical protein
MDWIYDQHFDGRRIWVLTMVDTHSRVTGAAIGHYESGFSRPSLERAKTLAALLGMQVEQIDVSQRTSPGGRKPAQSRKPRGKQRSARQAPAAQRRAAPERGKAKAQPARNRSGVTLTDPNKNALIEALRRQSAGRRQVLMQFMTTGAGAS